MQETLTLRYRRVKSAAVAPACAHGGSEDAGMDLCAAVDADVPPGKWVSVSTGICIELPPGYEGQVRPRSGLARKHGLTLLNSPGTIDPGYRGELSVTIINFGDAPYAIRTGDRIAQLVISRYARVRWVCSERLDETRRGQGGFGSTGR